MRQLVSSALFAFVPLVMGCEGPMGPEGPAGPQGPPGEDGPGTRVVYTGQLDANGEATAGPLPEELSLSDPPTLTCYVSDVPQGPYWVASDSDDCAIDLGPDGDLWITMASEQPEWYYVFVIVY